MIAPGMLAPAPMIRPMPRWLVALYDTMVCDGPRCACMPLWAPVAYIQSRTAAAPGHDPLQIVLHHHFCEAHKTILSIDEVIGRAGFKEKVEAAAKLIRPIDFKPDFEFTAYLAYFDIFSDDYKHWLRGQFVKRAA